METISEKQRQSIEHLPSGIAATHFSPAKYHLTHSCALHTVMTLHSPKRTSLIIAGRSSGAQLSGCLTVLRLSLSHYKIPDRVTPFRFKCRPMIFFRWKNESDCYYKQLLRTQRMAGSARDNSILLNLEETCDFGPITCMPWYYSHILYAKLCAGATGSRRRTTGLA
ncbi:hypothetical protein Zmor_007997 [Zophobas morio]|uniref:Uncharacterized protein n=1 Tax=Zophobas morio TaxID=2755281 RepID=A0AA38MMN3_9CUCU|nr:hypothetical protein Zmor_007997 [Zophobas morio]